MALDTTHPPPLPSSRCYNFSTLLHSIYLHSSNQATKLGIFMQPAYYMC